MRGRLGRSERGARARDERRTGPGSDISDQLGEWLGDDFPDGVLDDVDDKLAGEFAAEPEDDQDESEPTVGGVDCGMFGAAAGGWERAPAGPPAGRSSSRSGAAAVDDLDLDERAGSVRGTRSDAGVLRLTERDVDGLLFLGEMYGAQVDQLEQLLATTPGAVRLEWRAGLIALDEFSAVSGRMRLFEQTERWRSLGLAVQVGAQSWESLGPTNDERLRLATTSAGGILLMRSPSPEALCNLAGTKKQVELGVKIVDGGFGDEGTARLQDTYVVDPNKVRAFSTGQAVLIEGNACVYLQVAPYRPIPRALPATKTSADAPSNLVPKDATPEVPAPVVQPELPPTHEPDKPAPTPEQPRPVKPIDDLDDVFGEDRRR